MESSSGRLAHRVSAHVAESPGAANRNRLAAPVCWRCSALFKPWQLTSPRTHGSKQSASCLHSAQAPSAASPLRAPLQPTPKQPSPQQASPSSPVPPKMLLESIMSMSGAVRMGVLALLLLAASQYYRQQLSSLERAQFGGKEYIEDAKNGNKPAMHTAGGCGVTRTRMRARAVTSPCPACRHRHALPRHHTCCAHGRQRMRGGAADTVGCSGLLPWLCWLHAVSLAQRPGGDDRSAGGTAGLHACRQAGHGSAGRRPKRAGRWGAASQSQRAAAHAAWPCMNAAALTPPSRPCARRHAPQHLAQQQQQRPGAAACDADAGWVNGRELL